MRAAPADIRLQGVSKWYGLVMGLNDVSVRFGPGVNGLLGPNGAGKSTLLKIVVGALRPNLGRVEVGGREPFDDPAAMRRVGLVPEQDAFYPHVSVLDATTYFARLSGFPRAEARQRAAAVLERVGLGAVLDRHVSGFSKGMRQRAKLALALVHDPDILVLDEPLNGLDPAGRHEYGELLRALGREGACVLVSSHILHEVDLLARHLVVLHSGRVLAEGTTREIRADMAEYPLTVRVGSEGADAVAAAVIGLEGVLRVERIHTGLEVKTTRPDLLFDTMGRAAAEGRLDVRSLVPVDEDLEAVFRYLTQ